MKAYGKAIFRSVFHSGTRFLAIFAIVALGAGFYTGISSAAPQMRSTVDSYLDRQNMMDIEVLSTLGFSAQDVQAVQKAAGVEAVMPSYMEDVMSHIGEADVTVRVHALPQAGATDTGNASMNRPVLVSGRWPQSADECVLNSQRELELSLGSQITVQEQNGQKNLKYTKYKVVGFVQSPMYLSFSLGTTNIGNGQLGHYLYVMPQAFSSSIYTALYVTAKDARQLSTFTEQYQDKVTAVSNALTAVGRTRAPLRRNEVTADAQKKLDASKKTYESQKASAEQQFADAQKKLTAAQTQITQSQQTLSTVQAQITAGEKALRQAQSQYDSGLAEYKSQEQKAQKEFAAAAQKLQTGRQELAAARKKLADSRTQLEAQKKKLSDAKAELQKEENKLAAAKTQLEQSRAQLEAAAPAVEQARTALQALEDAGQGAGDEAAALRTKITEYDENTKKLDASQKEFDAGKEKLQQAQKTYQQQFAAAEPKLQQAEKELASGETQLAAKQKELSSGESTYQIQKAQADKELAAAKQKLESAQKQIAEKTQELSAAKKETAAGQQKLAAAEKTLQQNRSALEKTKTETQQKLATAKKQLEQGQKQLDAVKAPTWYVLDRDKNVGFNSFTSDADRMQSISRMFPLFFFLVAALVVLTTMTRMVEEDRMEIGSYKAMGFSERAIARKYLLYALLVSFFGSLAGVIIGGLVLPSICWNAYRIMYNAPAMTPQVTVSYAAAGSAAAIAVTLLSTWGACRAVLREKPAALLQPKAPKPGRRILLEHITPLWRHLNFTAKVTARNLFRYKKRLVMTVAGIAGCTALILTGFGIKDSVRHVVYDQYHGVDRYNTVISLQTGGLSDDTKKILQNQKNFQQWMLYTNRSVDISNTAGTSMAGNLLVPQNAAQLKDFVRLQNRTSKTPVAFQENSVLVTEKLANRLGLKVGSSVRAPDSTGKVHSFTVTGITENYIFHYVYIAPQEYHRVTGETPKGNGIWASYTGSEEASKSLSSTLMKQSGVETVAFLEDITSSFDNMINALNVIVVVLILCAGMLSFVVLYNLTNINITERSREMATLRVLGFYQRESAGYIYRETTLLTVLGSALGLLLGVFMHHAVITTVEVDVCMFPRTIDPLSFLWSLLLTAGFTVAVDLLMYPRFRKINMVESLKSVD
ncbi:MAG: ABC transporter permease [Oscillospiraceae bacterium]|jgi:putative ABC transport system permease protein|nr:ABC transporter permease [Oscillospiraceae bacterium]